MLVGLVQTAPQRHQKPDYPESKPRWSATCQHDLQVQETTAEHARQEYERFAERRREHKEAIGEAESIKALEDTAKQLDQRQKKPGGEK